MDDRAEAIDILTKMSTNHFYGHREQEALKIGAEALKQRWIPVTERLPETEDMYLVTRFNGKPMLDVAWFYIDEEGSGYFSCDLGDFAYVTAWMMPLPEPYKGGVQEWTMIL